MILIRKEYRFITKIRNGKIFFISDVVDILVLKCVTNVNGLLKYLDIYTHSANKSFIQLCKTNHEWSSGFHKTE